jgi:hypothetical protein
MALRFCRDPFFAELIERSFKASGQFIARHRRFLVTADEGSPGIKCHPRVNSRTHILQLQVVTSHGDLVDRPVLFARVTYNLGDLSSISFSLLRAGFSCSPGNRMALRYTADQVQIRLGHAREIGRSAVPYHMHVEDAWPFREEALVQP